MTWALLRVEREGWRKGERETESLARWGIGYFLIGSVERATNWGVVKAAEPRHSGGICCVPK